MSTKAEILANLKAEAARLETSKEDVAEWVERCASSLRRLYGKDSPEFAAFVQIEYDGIWSQDGHYDDQHGNREDGLRKAQTLLGAWQWVASNLTEGDTPGAPAHAVDRLQDALAVCERFHRVVLRLRRRGRNRDPLLVNDEWDAQYVFAALLAARFDDVAEEDPSPMMAGASSRIDFVLRPERIAIELKMTSDGLADKDLGELLAIDIIRYKAHRGVDTLICLVHDPQQLVRNRKGLETDLEKQSSAELRVIVLIR